MHVIINTAGLDEAVQPITNEAAELVRLSFNPSEVEPVERLKALAAAFVAACDAVEAGVDGQGIAPTEAYMQTAGMYAVVDGEITLAKTYMQTASALAVAVAAAVTASRRAVAAVAENL